MQLVQPDSKLFPFSFFIWFGSTVFSNVRIKLVLMSDYASF